MQLEINWLFHASQHITLRNVKWQLPSRVFLVSNFGWTGVHSSLKQSKIMSLSKSEKQKKNQT